MVAAESGQVHVCGVAESVGTGVIARWDGTTWDGTQWRGEPAPVVIEWGCHPQVSEEMVPALAWAWQQWAKVAAIEPVYVGRDARHVLYTHRRIDGGGGTLAWAQLPYGGDKRLESRIDASERWHLDPDTRPARGTIHLGGVMCHENGHLLGLPHDPTAARSLLDPTYGPDVLTPQAWDIAQARLRYGPPVDESPKPTPTPTPTPGDGNQPLQPATVQVGARTFVGTLREVA